MANAPDLSHLLLRDAYLQKFPETCYGLGEWRRYHNGIWNPLHELEIRREIQLVCEAAIRNGLDTSLTNFTVNSVYGLIQARQFVPDQRFNANPDLILFDDCSLSIVSRETQPHSPRNYCTSKLPFTYDPTLTSPTWDSFLNTTVNGCAEFLQEFAGYSLTTHTEHEIALWLHGPPGGGKSTFIAGLQSMLGERCCVLGLNDIESGHFGLANLPGKTLAVATEQPSAFVKAAHTLNAIISGEPINVDRKYHDAIIVTPQAKIVWAMNELPRIDSKGVGLFRRIKIVHFPGIDTSERDPRIKTAIQSSGMAIANWALNGLTRLHQRGAFLIPEDVDRATKYFYADNDIHQMFVDDCCEVEADARAQSSALYKAYSVWCQNNGYIRESARRFAHNMLRLGFTSVKNNVMYWCGLRLHPHLMTDDDVIDTYLDDNLLN